LNFGSACPPTNLTLPLLTTLNPTVPTLLSPSHAHVPKIALISLSGCTYREKLAVARAAPVGALVGIIFHSPSDPSFFPSPLPSSSPLLLGQSPNSSPLDQLGTVPPDPDDDIRGALSACDHIQPVLKVNSTVGAALLAGLGRHAEPRYAYAVVGAAGAKPTMNRTTSDDMGGWPPALPSRNGNPWFVGLAGLGIISRITPSHTTSLLHAYKAAVYLRRRYLNYLAQRPLHQIVITYKDPSGTSVRMSLPYPV
ncbi:hypothetical protein BC936DRAFT_144891, partial [Jimgerdemannia flammicorona]